MNEEDYWTPNMIKLLINTRLDSDNAFSNGKKSKTTLWRIVHSEIIKVNIEFPFSAEEAKKKFNNLMTTYKRIKKRNSETGKGRTYWPYFEAFDVVFGTKHFVAPPAGIILDSLSSETYESSNVIEQDVADQSPAKKTKTNLRDVLDFLKEMEANEENRHQEQMALENQKLDIEFKKLEILQIIYKSQ